MKQNRRVLLIEPPFQRLYGPTFSLNRFPFALAYLAGAIRGMGEWDVSVYNADFAPRGGTSRVRDRAQERFEVYVRTLRDLDAPIWGEVRAVLSEYRPAVVGITAKSQNFTSACNVARLAKELDQECTVVVGGPHPSMVGGQVLTNPHIDICVRGEGEVTITEVLRALENGSTLQGIQGVVFREEKRTVENPPRPLMEDLDALPYPAEVAPAVLRDYHSYPSHAFTNIFATRGCPFNCFFCGSRKIWGRKVRFRSPENVIEEIHRLYKKGIRLVHFDDDTFGVKKEYIRRICTGLMEQCPGIRWSSEIHVKLVDEETTSLMKKSGCWRMQIGIESGNNRILQEMRKGITIEEAMEACRVIRRHGIELEAFFIVGFPQETEESLRDTITAIERSRADTIAYSIFMPYPGTESFEFCRECGLVDENWDISLYNHQSPHNCFCLNIEPKRFRQLLTELEITIDRKNARRRLLRLFTGTSLAKLRQHGWREGMRRGLRAVANR
jgi:anaerobic magnesium-protoporphyrin IX monomethyl ester cyclase